ncbi:substrate-binding periplasmic protein [Aquipseudomonas alcaligenes]|uniref:substrate-binding periplasmic protein n=1 Tax=Aquipseudomonas alcaligenes TaxID=43263 RepID=UPI003748B034
MKPRVFGWLAASLLCADGALAQTYVVGVEQQAFQPHYWQDEQGEYRGFAREVLDLFARDAGIELRYQTFPVSQLTQQLLDGNVDFKYPDSPRWAIGAKQGAGVAYSQPVVSYVDGVLVAPAKLGQGVEHLQRLALVEGWTPGDYQERIAAGKTQLVRAADLKQMLRLAMRDEAQGAYYNVVVATYYLDNIRTRPGALVFDPSLPHSRGSFHLSSVRQAQLLKRFDQFLQAKASEIAALKERHGVEAGLNSEYLGMEQWKVDFLKRQKEKRGESK